MSTITKEFTKEQLQQIIETDHVQCGDASALARIAIASLEAEPVAWRYRHHNGLAPSNWKVVDSENECNVAPNYQRQALYTAQPAPVSVPDAMADDIDSDDHPLLWSYNNGWNACRAAMLQGADGNSPVLPDGWVLVPVEPTAEMISSGIAVHYERSQIQIHDRPAPGPMECAYVAMLAAAPQQEVKS